MYIATNETQSSRAGAVNVLPSAVRRYMNGINLEEATELRLITGKPFIIRYPDGDYYLTKKAVLSISPVNTVNITAGMMNELLERITKSSLYSVKDEISSGYITIEGGHRAGVAGTAVTENGEVEFIRNISAVNIRLANEVIGASERIMGKIAENGVIKNTLIISPPGAGKTTMLRDITRSLSYMGYAVAVADERCEIAAMCGGKSSFDLGNMTAVTDNCPKDRAMIMLLRSMSPDVIITDEIGTCSDIEAVEKIMNSGVAVIASVHGRDTAQIMRRKDMSELAEMFDIEIVLSKRCGAGTVEEIRENG